MRGLAIVVPFLLGCSFNANGRGVEEESSSGEPPAGTSAPATTDASATTDVATGSATGTSDGTTGDDGTSSSSGTTGPALMCGEALDPPAGGCDPEVCTEGCPGGTCHITCMGSGECEGDTIWCPDDRPCSILCSGARSCRQAQIACPPHHACSVECYGSQACAGMDLVCGGGPCSLACNTGENVCGDELAFHCGSNDSTVTCNSAQPEVPKVNPTAETGCECSSSCVVAEAEDDR